jgi:hypothetical protein
MRESQQVEERVASISDLADWDRETSTAGDKLVVLEVGLVVAQLHMHASGEWCSCGVLLVKHALSLPTEQQASYPKGGWCVGATCAR